MALWHIVYVSSSASGVLSCLDLKEILDEALRKNKINDITGMLLYFAGTFMQVIEGEESVLRVLLSKIEKDHRHKGIIVLLDEEIEERSFFGFSMDCKELLAHNFSLAPEQRSFLHDGFTSAHITSRPSVALELVKSFKNSCVKFSIF